MSHPHPPSEPTTHPIYSLSPPLHPLALSDPPPPPHHQHPTSLRLVRHRLSTLLHLHPSQTEIAYTMSKVAPVRYCPYMTIEPKKVVAIGLAATAMQSTVYPNCQPAFQPNTVLILRLSTTGESMQFMQQVSFHFPKCLPLCSNPPPICSMFFLVPFFVDLHKVGEVRFETIEV